MTATTARRRVPAQLPVNLDSPDVTSVVDDATTNGAWDGTEFVGASAYDTSTVTGVAGFAPTGTISYTFWANATCANTGTNAGTALTLGSKSNIEGPLAAGAYSFEVSYGGDSNYSGSTSSCEPFTVAATSSSTSTMVDDAATNVPWSGTEQTGASAYDTSTVTGVAGIAPTGTISYTFWANGTCANTGTGAGTGLSLGSPSLTQGPLAAGSYSFQATYSGDSDYTSSTSSCESFIVGGGGTAGVSTTVDDAATNNPWSGAEKTGASAYDTSTVTGVAGIAPTGTIGYTFWANGTCAKTGTGAGSGLSLGSPSLTQGPLSAGSYSFQATYSGDSNYASSTSSCESLTVGGGGTAGVTTTVDDAATNNSWSGTEKTGASGYDTSTVTGVAGIAPTGTISYTFWANGTCSSTGTNAGTALTLGSKSTTEGPLAAGSYSFQATYSGDSNYASSTSSCESLTVGGGGTASVNTTVDDAATGNPWGGTEKTGASAYDTSTVTGVAGIAPTGTISYTFWANGTCANTGTNAGTALALGSKSTTEVPLAAGSYSFQATYSGDSDYTSSTSSCESFSVAATSSSTSTMVDDAATNNSWSGTEKTGALAYDTSTVTGVAGIAPTGTISYTFWANGTCAKTGTGAGSGLSLGSPSLTQGPLAAGSYSFQATYSGDSNYASSTSSCESLTVGGGGTAGVTTTVDDAATNNSWSGTEKTGASGYDTSTVTGVAGIAPTGTISYTFWANGTCANTGTGAGTGLSLGSPSLTQGPLAAGSYSFEATYSGDSDYTSSTSSCESFSVAATSSSTSTTVDDAATNNPWSGTEKTGASAYDTSTVTGVAGIAPTGTISYTFWANGTCANTGTNAGAALALGSKSTTEGPLAAGSYSFAAKYSGDSNYASSTSSCEPFSVAATSSSTSTVVDDAATNNPWSGTEQTGVSAYDTSTVTGVAGIAPTGTISYTFWANGTCANTGTSAGTALTLGSKSTIEGPLAAGFYSFEATYSGDTNYATSTSNCEPFSVAKASPTITTVASPLTGTVGIAITPAKDSATFVGTTSVAPTGSVAFALYSNSTCVTAVVGVSGTGSISTTGGVSSASYSATTWTPPAAVTYYWEASYTGDANYNGFTTACGGTNEQIAVGKASPTISTTASPTTGTAGIAIKPVKDVATFFGTTSVAPPTGSVTFTLYSNSTCTTAVTGVTGAGPISMTSGVSSAAYSVNWTPTTAGTFFWMDSYAGDANNKAFTTACGGTGEQILIAVASPTMTTLANPTTGTVGADIANLSDKATFSSTGAAAPTGSVTFTLYSNSACTTAVSGVSGSGAIASLTASYGANWKPATAGTYYWVATYPGDATNAPVSSACGSETVVIAVPVSRITPSATTCAQFASGFATALPTIQYTLTGSKIGTVTPSTFTYWVKVTSGGTYTIAQSISETSKKLLLVSSGSKGGVYDNATPSSCSSVSGAKFTQNTTSGTVTVKFTSSSGPFYIGLNFSTTKVIGEAARVRARRCSISSVAASPVRPVRLT